MKKFGGIDHKQERLYIHWDIMTLCNYNCNYCYAKHAYSRNNLWQKQSNKNIIDNVITSLQLSELPIFLGLLGGEPTLSKHYNYIIDKISDKIIQKHDDNRLYITTNLSKDINYWKNHKKITKTFILSSFHPQYNQTEDDIKIFIEKLLYLKDYFKVKINIMLDPKFNNVNKLWLKYLPDISKYIIIHPHIIYPDGSPFNDLSKIYNNSFEEYKEFYKYMHPEYILENINDKLLLTDYDVFSNNIQSFKGWKCFQNNYEISSTGEVTNLCFSSEKDNLNKNIFYFKKIKNIRGRICNHEWCNCDGLLKCNKIKE